MQRRVKGSDSSEAPSHAPRPTRCAHADRQGVLPPSLALPTHIAPRPRALPTRASARSVSSLSYHMSAVRFLTPTDQSTRCPWPWNISFWKRKGRSARCEWYLHVHTASMCVCACICACTRTCVCMCVHMCAVEAEGAVCQLRLVLSSAPGQEAALAAVKCSQRHRKAHRLGIPSSAPEQ